MFDSLGVGTVIAVRHSDCGLLHLAEESISDGIERSRRRGRRKRFTLWNSGCSKTSIGASEIIYGSQIKVMIFTTALVPTTAKDQVVF